MKRVAVLLLSTVLVPSLMQAQDAVLVAHYYTSAELQDLAEETGGCVSDSLEMARFGHAHPAKTLIVAGVSTSGCVRATVTDAFSNNFRVTMVEDGCFDRSEASHAINLRDLDAKYADVIGESAAITHLENLT